VSQSNPGLEGRKYSAWLKISSTHEALFSYTRPDINPAFRPLPLSNGSERSLDPDPPD
jgi:hypothetical protein